MSDLSAHIRISVIDTKGSVPREAGTVMLVFAKEIEGTIGGGALEFEAISHARSLMKAIAIKPWQREVQTRPLGPALGQCCGGSVTLLFERHDATNPSPIQSGQDGVIVRPLCSNVAPNCVSDRHDIPDNIPLAVHKYLTSMLSGQVPRLARLIKSGQDSEDWWVEPVSQKQTPLVLYGAGHVGRAVVKAFADLPFDIIWVDTDVSRFPDIVPPNATRLVAVHPAEAVAHTPEEAFHIVMTFSHAIDLDICHAVLKRGAFSFLGLIGSKTKRERFLKRLQDLGVDAASLARLTCPIGIAGLKGKEPEVIALSVAAQMVQIRQGMSTSCTEGLQTEAFL